MWIPVADNSMTNPVFMWFVLVIVPLAILTAVLSACAPVALVNAVLPSDHYRLLDGLAYETGSAEAAATSTLPASSAARSPRVGRNPRQVLDLYIPTRATPASRAPVVVFFYGGSWQNGNRQLYRFVGEALARRGFVAVVPDYRVYPEVMFPAFVEDGAAAVRWVVENVAAYGGDDRRVFLMGHSAGAHIAAMLALDPSYLEAAGVDRARLHGMIGLSGPYDFLPLTDPKLQAVFGSARSQALSQPVRFVAASQPPLLLLHGLDDSTVSPGNSARLAAATTAAGASVKLIELPGYGHLGVLARMAAPLRAGSPVLDDIAEFVSTH
jgi:acetyl esterase/lipase